MVPVPVDLSNTWEQLPDTNTVSPNTKYTILYINTASPNTIKYNKNTIKYKYSLKKYTIKTQILSVQIQNTNINTFIPNTKYTIQL